MDTKPDPIPSVHEANKLVRVLEGKVRKYTVRVTLPDNRVIELQSDTLPSLKYNDEARGLWLTCSSGDYSSYPVMSVPEGVIIQCEENPK